MRMCVHHDRQTAWAGLLLCLTLTGCATGPHANPVDPLEPYNRVMHDINDSLDRTLLKPVATVYHDATPELVRRGVGNFFANLKDAWSFVNHVLQLKPEGAAGSLMRVGVNTLFGLGGILDVASEMRIERRTEDFGQTLGHWGVGPGPYIVLPVLGPSTLRDTVALSVDTQGDAVALQEDIALRNTGWVLRAVDDRARLLLASDVVEGAALDKYTFIRDAYLQRRRNLVFDGNPPDDPPEEDPDGSGPGVTVR